MDRLDHESVAYGDYVALGALFRPVSDEFASRKRGKVRPINGWLAIDDPPKTDPSWTLELSLPIVGIVYMVSSDGKRVMTGKLMGGKPGAPSSSTIFAPDEASYMYVLIEAGSGAYVTSFNAAADETVSVGPEKLRALNNPGLPDAPRKLPSPSLSGSPLPGDSPPIVVGTGMLAKNYVVVRTQHWQKSTDSYSLPGCSGLSVTQTQTSGVTRSTSVMSEVAGAVDVTTSLGWGPISAALSASMSRMSSSAQEVSIAEETTATVIHEFANPYQTAMVVFLWQLVDRFYIFEWTTDYELKAMVETIILPSIPRVYDASGGPFPPLNPVTCTVSAGVSSWPVRENAI